MKQLIAAGLASICLTQCRRVMTHTNSQTCLHNCDSLCVGTVFFLCAVLQGQMHEP